ncbi:MAG TPA: sigma-70 family RNA polymerase sigma factor [Flavisolibacter sp.]
MHTETDERELISRVLKGDTQAFSILVDRYRSFVFTISLRYLAAREDAEEVAQDVFIKAYRSLADFRGASKFSTWLYTITTTSCLTALRRKKLEVQSLDKDHVFEAAESVDSGMSANQVERKSRIQMVNEAIAMLSPDDANIITLFYKGEQSLEEIAQILGKETNAVKVQLHRARTRLKDKMEKHFSHEIRDIF